MALVAGTQVALRIEPVRAIVLFGKTPILFETLLRDRPWGPKT
jgi:hypothetical protein